MRERMLTRASVNEGVGILQVWNACRRQEARDRLAAHGRSGQGAEATRMIAVVDAAAERRADPDAGWE